jgi:uncharacterized membrane protein YcaP (DUF421 family)
MLDNLFTFSLPPLNFAIRAIVVYVFVLVLLRIAGKRQLGQMGATEFVAILLISNAVQNSMNGGDNSLGAGLLLAAILIIMSTLISYLTYRSKFFSTIFEGTPTLLVHNGKAIPKNLRHERLSAAELQTLLRKQGIHDLKDIATAILESDGTLSVTRTSDIAARTPASSP